MRSVTVAAAIALACVSVLSVPPAAAQARAKSKLSTSLLALQRSQAKQSAARSARQGTARRTPFMLRTSGGYVEVSAFGADLAALRTQLESKGMLDAKVHDYSVTGKVPLAAIADMANTPGLQFMKRSLRTTHAGIVTSQGDKSMRANIARQQFDVTGKGVRVGVLSDSFDCAPGPFAEGQRFSRAKDDVRTDDLPPGIHVLEDLSDELSDDCADEGRAMMQIVHDVAPGAKMSFHTAFVSEQDFADGIIDLAKDGADVIVDDVVYFDEPMFENGIVADSVNRVVSQGIAYFSSAGNEERLSYESAFRPHKDKDGVVRQDFANGRGVDTLQHVTIPSQGDTVIALDWDEPSLSANGVRGSRSNVDLVFYNMDGTPVQDCDTAPDDATFCQFAGISDNVGADAVELAEIINVGDNPLEVQVGIELIEGPAPNVVKYDWFDFGEPYIVDEFDTRSNTVFGHANAQGAEAVGGAWWFDTAAFGAANHPQCNKACVNSYSSAGGTPILFDERGRRLSNPFLGFKPGVTGPDGGNTTFFFFNQTTPAPGEPDDFPNFFGTSAAAPHVAAVAALMLEKRKGLQPREIYTVLRATAEDIRLRSLDTRDPTATVPIPNSKGFDFDSGFGLVNAQAALKAISGH
ncbi:MAG TPA: S8 family serine peptidase [Steroidobacteraceae bacterium]|jgi:subtilisin family serine protease